MADFRRGDLVELPDGERWTVETTPGSAAEAVSLCRTGSAGPPLAETSSNPAAQLRLVQASDLRSLGKGADIDHIVRQDRRRQPGGWLGEILRPARTVTPAGEAQIQRAAETAAYLEQWRGPGGQGSAWARWAARRAAQQQVLRVTAENDPDVQVVPRATWADADRRRLPAAAQDPVVAFARHAVQVLRAWRETDAAFLDSRRGELEAADPGRFEAESAGLWDRQATLSAVAAALTASDPDVTAAAEGRREALEFNRSLLASVGAEFGGIPDLDPNVGSLAARHASEEVEEAEQAYDQAYDDAFARYYGQVERTWDIDGSFPVVAGDSEVSPDAASWSPPTAPSPAGPCTVTEYFVTNGGSTLHYTLASAAGDVLGYSRDQGGNVAAQVQAGSRWTDLAEQDPRYQAVIQGVREHEARNPGLAGYNNPAAAIRDLSRELTAVAGSSPEAERDKLIAEAAESFPEFSPLGQEQAAIDVDALANWDGFAYPPYEGPGYTEPPVNWEGNHSDHERDHYWDLKSGSAGPGTADPEGPRDIPGEDSPPSAGQAPASPPVRRSETTAHRAQDTPGSPHTARGAPGPQVQPSLDYPGPVTPGTRAQRAAVPRAAGQSARPGPRRTL